MGALRTQTLKLRFLYVTDSTLKPIVGIVVTTSPICALCQRNIAERRACREPGRGADLESVQKCCLAGVVLQSTSSAMQVIP